MCGPAGEDAPDAKEATSDKPSIASTQDSNEFRINDSEECNAGRDERTDKRQGRGRCEILLHQPRLNDSPRVIGTAEKEPTRIHESSIDC